MIRRKGVFWADGSGLPACFFGCRRDVPAHAPRDANSEHEGSDGAGLVTKVQDSRRRAYRANLSAEVSKEKI